MKRKMIVLLTLIFAFICLFSACGSSAAGAEKALISGMDALKAGNYETLGDYFTLDSELFGAVTEAADGEDLSQYTELLPLITGSMTYEILSIEENENTATAELSITNKDLSGIMTAVISQLMSTQFSSILTGNIDIDGIAEEVVQSARNAIEKQTETVTNTVTVQMSKTGDKWLIAADDDFADAVSGGLASSLDRLQSSFANLF